MNSVYKMPPEERVREYIRMREKALHDEASLIEEAMEKGEARGREEDRAEVIKIMLSDNRSPEEIASILHMNIDKVKKITESKG